MKIDVILDPVLVYLAFELGNALSIPMPEGGALLVVSARMAEAEKTLTGWEPNRLLFRLNRKRRQF